MYISWRRIVRDEFNSQRPVNNASEITFNVVTFLFVKERHNRLPGLTNELLAHWNPPHFTKCFQHLPQYKRQIDNREEGQL